MRTLFLLALFAMHSEAQSAVRIVSEEQGIDASVAEDGSFAIGSRTPAWSFKGTVGFPVQGIVQETGSDLAGAFHQISFKYASSGDRSAAIRIYDLRPVVLFVSKFEAGGPNKDPFPKLTFPGGLHHLSYLNTFAHYDFKNLGTDGPTAFFDDQARTFLFSPASHYMDAQVLADASAGWLSSGISSTLASLPAGYTQASALVVGQGVNRTFETWGKFLTDFAGKTRPANDADFGLKYLGYWTDHGAEYYYQFEPSLGYEGTLYRVRDEFAQIGISLGYLQLDSWFYQKGPGDWHTGGDGIYLYEAKPDYFPKGLQAFQQKLGLPLVTHSRWIDPTSPYRQQYRISGNVSIDPALWAKWMDYLSQAGVRTYEQDWLSGPAVTANELGAGELFMDEMAAAAHQRGITLQYCMPLPRHFLQGTHYSNLMTIRTSDDHFQRIDWEPFLMTARLASALGEWPWTDVFMSSETQNLLLSNLSGSMVGVGDAIGALNRENLMKVVRPDATIVKPDRAIVPVDSVYVDEANGRATPIVAAASTDHGAGMLSSFVFAFSRAGTAKTELSPAALGYTGDVYSYDFFSGSGSRIQAGHSEEIQVDENGSYFVVAPVGASGMAFLGDKGKFVSTGRARVSELSDRGVIEARIELGAGENQLTLHGFSPTRPVVRADVATVRKLTFDSKTGLFQFDLADPRGRSIQVTLSKE